MPIVESMVEDVIKQVANAMRRADPAHMDVEMARKIRPAGKHEYTLGDELTITIQIRKEKI